MVQMNLFAGQEERHRHTDELVDTEGKGRVGQIGKVALTYIQYHVSSR